MWRLRFKARADEAGARARDGQGVKKSGLVEKADIGRDRGVERGDIADAPVERIAGAQLGARQRRDLLDREHPLGSQGVRHAPVHDESLSQA